MHGRVFRSVLFFLLAATLQFAPEGCVGANRRGASSGVTFTAHRIGGFRSEACCVADFNNDGKLDILAGHFWYEAPDFKAHKFRSLDDKLDPAGKRHVVDAGGKGYYDDFLNAPLDVDGDGFVDLITCGWFSKSIDWYRNPGAAGGDWPLAGTAVNGNFETGDLVDIDGDGKAAEILAHTQDTRWYEPGLTAEGKSGLICHIVCDKPMNFGGGVGDVNGDGRPDIIRPDAWFEAPDDPRDGKWKEHPIALGGLEEGESAHTPQIAVYDVDGDGLNDLITSNAHHYGIFWYKQHREDGGIAWRKNLIDKSWSQAHSITLADFDNDGDMDFATGKRFLAHNGGDPGAGDPMGVYWYELRRGRSGTVRWIKHVISRDEGVSAALNIPVADMDGDGDLDLVVTGKWGGPVYFENKLK